MTETEQPRPLRAIDALIFNVYYFSVNVQTLTLVPLLMPILVERFLNADIKGSALGTLRLVTLMISLLVHTLAAQLSDRCTSKLGRRKPFMLLSLFLETLVLLGLGLTISYMKGSGTYAMVFTTITLAMVFSNLGLGPAQAIIPDLVPQEKHGRFAAVKSLFELPLPVIFVAFTIAKLISHNQFWGVIWILIAVKVVSGLITLLIPEKPILRPTKSFDKDSILRLVAMTLAFTGIILLLGLGARYALPIVKSLMTNSSHFKILNAAFGIFAMAVAVVIGVAISTRLSLGDETQGRRRFTWWVINRLAFMVGATNLVSFVLYFLQERFPQLAGEAAARPTAILMTVVGLALLLAALLAGWLTDKWGPKPLLFISGFLAFGASVMVVLSDSLFVVYAGAAVIGIATGLFYSANWALGTRIVPRDEAGKWLGISNVAGAGAGAVGAYIGGPIGDNAGYAVLMLVYGVVFLLSTLALFGINPQKQDFVPEKSE